LVYIWRWGYSYRLNRCLLLFDFYGWLLLFDLYGWLLLYFIQLLRLCLVGQLWLILQTNLWTKTQQLLQITTLFIPHSNLSSSKIILRVNQQLLGLYCLAAQTILHRLFEQYQMQLCWCLCLLFFVSHAYNFKLFIAFGLLFGLGGGRLGLVVIEYFVKKMFGWLLGSILRRVRAFNGWLLLLFDELLVVAREGGVAHWFLLYSKELKATTLLN